MIPNYNNRPPSNLYPGYATSSGMPVPAQSHPPMPNSFTAANGLPIPTPQHQPLPYGAVSLDEFLKKQELNINLLWRGYPVSNARPPPPMRMDYRMPELIDRNNHPAFDSRRMAYPNLYHSMLSPPPLPGMNVHHPSLADRQLMDYEMMRYRTFNRHEPGMAPLPTEPKRKDKVPEVIVLDSDDSVKESSAPQPQPPQPPPAQPKPTAQPSKPESPPAPPSPPKKTRQHKQKVLQKKTSAPAKQTSILPSKRPQKPVVTKPPQQDQPKPARNLKFKMKKIAKHHTKSESGNQQRQKRESRATAEDKNLPKYGDTHGKIKSGVNYQADISEFLGNDKQFMLQKEQKAQQLGQRLKWTSSKNSIYKAIREKYPTADATKVISYLTDGKTSDPSCEGFQLYMEANREESKARSEAEEGQQQKEEIAQEGGRVTRQNLKNKTLPI